MNNNFRPTREERIEFGIKKAVDWLSLSAKSKKQIELKLRENRIVASKEEAEEITGFLVSNYLLDEQANAESLLPSMHARFWGRKRIENKLFEAGYPSDMIDIILDDEEYDYLHACLDLFHTRYSAPATDPLEKKKQTAFLVTHGYTFSEIREALSMGEEP